MTTFGTGTFGGPDLATLPTDTPLSAFRTMVASILDVGNVDVAVHADMVDSVSPPAYLLAALAFSAGAALMLFAQRRLRTNRG